MSITIPHITPQPRRQALVEEETGQSAPRVAPPFRIGRLGVSTLALGAIALGGLAWQALTAAQAVPAYVLPAPGAVWAKWLTLWNSGLLWRNASTTLREALLGLPWPLWSARPWAYALARSRVLAGVLAPYVAASQAVPVIALAPLLVLWFGLGLLPKVLTCALIVFFPILINTVAGLRTVDRALPEVGAQPGRGRAANVLARRVAPGPADAARWGESGLTLAMTGAWSGSSSPPTRAWASC